MDEQKRGLRVGVLMSGGVDSSAAAHLLLRDGYDVSGVFIAIRNPSHIPCTSVADRQDAMRACAALGIPFLEYDATDEYRQKVIDPFVEAYRRGETPNPDVLCNVFIKFGVVFDFLRGRGFDRVATGHYARAVFSDGAQRLCRSADERKDQTYFMYTISQEVLDCALFPVGEHTKAQVRSIALKVGLPAARKKDSVGLCFLGDVSMKDFLSVYIKPKEGEVRLAGSGKVIGVHDGSWFYTIGQRHGFTVSGSDKGPYVVVQKDVRCNTLFVQKDAVIGGCKEFHLTDSVLRRVPARGKPVYARYRHGGEVHPIEMAAGDTDSVKIVFANSHAIAPGQSVVLYGEDGECFGGGVVRVRDVG